MDWAAWKRHSVLRLLFLLLALAADVVQTSAQDTLATTRLYLGSTSCAFSTGSGTPSGGATCDFYLDTATGDLWTRGTSIWSKVNAGGTVTSVGLTLPTQFSVSGSPVTSSGTLAAAWVTQSANAGLFGPTSGGAAAPTFRSLVAADVPGTLNATTFTGHVTPTTTDTYDLGSAANIWRQSFVSQMNATLFAKATQTLYGGWLSVSKNAGTFAVAVASTDTSVDFGTSMTTNQFVLVRAADTGGTITEEYFKVGSLVSGTRYNVTRNLSGVGLKNWAMGTPFQVRGIAGDGWIELNAFDTPRFSIFQQGSAYNNSTEQIRIGYLTGMPNSSTGLGAYMGDATHYLRWDGSALTVVSSDVNLTAGDTTLSSSGLTLALDTAAFGVPSRAVKWTAANGTAAVNAFDYAVGADQYRQIFLQNTWSGTHTTSGDKNSQIELFAQSNPSGGGTLHQTHVLLTAGPAANTIDIGGVGPSTLVQVNGTLQLLGAGNLGNVQLPSNQVLTNTSTYDFPNAGSARGILFVTSEEDTSTCEFMMRAGSGITVLAADPVGICSATAGNASTLNIYWNAGTSSYRVQNNRGGTRTLEFVMVGTGIM